MPIENKPYIEAMRLLRRSNAAGTHGNKRDRRKRTRKAAKDAAVREETKDD